MGIVILVSERHKNLPNHPLASNDLNFIRMVLRFIKTTIFVERKSTQAFHLSVMVHWVVEVHDSKNCFVCLIYLANLFNKIFVLEDSLLFH